MIEADEETQRSLHRLLAAFRQADLHGLAVHLNGGSGHRTPTGFKSRLRLVKQLMESRPPLEGQQRLIETPLKEFEARLEQLG